MVDGTLFGLIMADIMGERIKQDTKWGEQNHIPTEWGDVLAEEYLELNVEYLKLQRTLNDNHWHPTDETANRLRAELIQVVAVGAAMLECGMRNGWWENDGK